MDRTVKWLASRYGRVEACPPGAHGGDDGAEPPAACVRVTARPSGHVPVPLDALDIDVRFPPAFPAAPAVVRVADGTRGGLPPPMVRALNAILARLHDAPAPGAMGNVAPALRWLDNHLDEVLTCLVALQAEAAERGGGASDVRPGDNGGGRDADPPANERPPLPTSTPPAGSASAVPAAEADARQQPATAAATDADGAPPAPSGTSAPWAALFAAEWPYDAHRRWEAAVRRCLLLEGRPAGDARTWAAVAHAIARAGGAAAGNTPSPTAEACCARYVLLRASARAWYRHHFPRVPAGGAGGGGGAAAATGGTGVAVAAAAVGAPLPHVTPAGSAGVALLPVPPSADEGTEDGADGGAWASDWSTDSGDDTAPAAVAAGRRGAAAAGGSGGERAAPLRPRSSAPAYSAAGIIGGDKTRRGRAGAGGAAAGAAAAAAAVGRADSPPADESASADARGSAGATPPAAAAADGSEGAEGADDDAGGAAAPPPAALFCGVDVSGAARRGIALTLTGLSLHGVGAMAASRVGVNVQCTRCGTVVAATVSLRGADVARPGDDVTDGGAAGAPAGAGGGGGGGSGGGATPPTGEFREWCAKCSLLLTLAFRPALMFDAGGGGGGAGAAAAGATLGYVDATHARVAGVADASLLASCLECGAVATVPRFAPPCTHEVACRTCFLRLRIAARATRVDDVDGGRAAAPAAAHPPPRASLQRFAPGQPLPDRGACRHYKHSYRWLRFACCGVAFACDACHDDACDHPHEWARRMICGTCAREQPWSNEPCVACGARMGRSAAGPRARFWEGGAGQRDARMLSRNDSRKHKGEGGKTVSKKAERVGPKKDRPKKEEEG